MSIWGRRVSIRLVATAVAVVLLGVLAVAVTRPAPREITLVVRGMAFFLESSDLPNPTIVVAPGERVRIVLRNEERGIQHDFAAPRLGAAIDLLGWNESDTVTFVAPSVPGVYDYWCRPHMMMMRGRIMVKLTN
jgi:hypothetical protein